MIRFSYEEMAVDFEELLDAANAQSNPLIDAVQRNDARNTIEHFNNKYMNANGSGEYGVIGE